jgi:CRISPR/Cas system-associated protein endoribonuclease Cas2
MKRLLYIFIVLLVSCSQPTKDSRNSTLKKVSINKSDFSKTVYNTSDIVENQYYIPLETIDSINLIGRIDKIIFTNDRIFILDRNISKTLFIFSINGDYISKIDKQGDGPGEFKNPQDFVFNDDNDNLILYCRNNMKFIFFDIDGKYQSEMKLGLNFRSFVLKDNNYLAFTHSIYNSSENEGDILYDFITMDIHGKIVIKQFPNDIEVGNSGVVITHNDYFSRDRDNYYLSWVFNDTVYTINNDNSAVPYCFFDFNDKSMPNDVLNERDNVKMYRDVILDGVYWSKYGPLKATNDLFIINISAGRSDEIESSIYAMLFSLKTNRKIIFNKISNENDDAVFNFPVSTYKDYFVSVLYPEEVLLNKSDNNSSIFLKGVETKIAEFDNPVLMLTKFKSL